MVRRIQGWDPLLILSQIITLQTLHYLLLTLLIPPTVQLFSDSHSLTYAGGPYVTGYVLDWREIASKSTARPLPRQPPRQQQPHTRRATTGDGSSDTPFYLQGHDIERTHYAVKDEYDHDNQVWDYGVSRRRGWLISTLWIVVSCLDIIPLYYLVRKPTHILDFSLTLTFIHVVMTTYTTHHLPTSIWFWIVMLLGAAIMVTGAEQLCVWRELKEGLGATEVVDPSVRPVDGNGEADSYELQALVDDDGDKRRWS